MDIVSLVVLLKIGCSRYDEQFCYTKHLDAIVMKSPEECRVAGLDFLKKYDPNERSKLIVNCVFLQKENDTKDGV